MSEQNRKQLTEAELERQQRSKQRGSFEQRWVRSMLRELNYRPEERARWQRFARS